MTDATAERDGIAARYFETESERVLAYERGEAPEEPRNEGGEAAGARTAAITQNREGYAMLKVRPTADGDELERYYGFDVALDHAAELLGAAKHDLPVPEPAEDMGM
jgi:hypothetical protein